MHVSSFNVFLLVYFECTVLNIRIRVVIRDEQRCPLVVACGLSSTASESGCATSNGMRRPRAASVNAHPLNPGREAVLDDNRSAAPKARHVLGAARHRHRARRLRARVHPVVGVTDRTSGLQLEKRVDAVGAKRVKALERLLLFNCVHADDAVVRPDHARAAVSVCHRFATCEHK